MQSKILLNSFKATVLIGLIAGYTTLSGCSTQPVKLSPAASQPAFDLRNYFDGPIKAWGQFEKRDGSIARRFEVDITASWQGNTGTLDERFVYDDGSTEQRIWTLTDLGNGKFEGRAGDVIGVAQGQATGSVFRWQYTLRLPVGDTSYDVQFDDRMFRYDGQHMMNRATVKKFGFRVGEVTLFFQKPQLQTPQPQTSQPASGSAAGVNPS